MAGKLVRMEGVLGREHGESLCGDTLVGGAAVEAKNANTAITVITALFIVLMILNDYFIGAKLGGYFEQQDTYFTDKST